MLLYLSASTLLQSLPPRALVHQGGTLALYISQCPLAQLWLAAGLWLQVISSRFGQRLALPVFICALRVCLRPRPPKVPLWTSADATTSGRGYPHIHPLTTCPSSRAAFTRLHTAVRVSQEPLNQVVCGLEVQADISVDLAITCPAAPTFLFGIIVTETPPD